MSRYRVSRVVLPLAAAGSLLFGGMNAVPPAYAATASPSTPVLTEPSSSATGPSIATDTTTVVGQPVQDSVACGAQLARLQTDSTYLQQLRTWYGSIQVGPCAPAASPTASSPNDFGFLVCSSGLSLMSNNVGFLGLSRLVYTGYFLDYCDLPTTLIECDDGEFGPAAPPTTLGFSFGGSGCDAVTLPSAFTFPGAPFVIEGEGIAYAGSTYYDFSPQFKLAHA